MQCQAGPPPVLIGQCSKKSTMIVAPLRSIFDDDHIKKSLMAMPLFNILVLCGNTPPTDVSIVDCTSYMNRGGKKDTTYILGQFQRKVDEIDVDKKLTDCFFFDGALNVQTAGAILCAMYPRTICFHGEEHVLSLFFSDLSKLKPIQVSSTFLVCLFWFHFLTYFSAACYQVLQALQCFWIWCQPWNICTVYCSSGRFQ